MEMYIKTKFEENEVKFAERNVKSLFQLTVLVRLNHENQDEPFSKFSRYKSLERFKIKQ